MNFNLQIEKDRERFKTRCNQLLDAQKPCELKETKNTRTNAQNAARWVYLEQVAQILNDRGETFTVKGLKIEVPYTKENLYENYWQTLRGYMYPEKKDQLTRAEFSSLVEMVLMMFAQKFDISINFPSFEG